MNLSLLTTEDINAFTKRFPTASLWLQARTMHREYQGLLRKNELSGREVKRLQLLKEVYANG